MLPNRITPILESWCRMNKYPVVEISEGKISKSIFVINTENQELLRFELNGDIYIKGNLVENDKEVVDAFREFLKIPK